MTGKFFFFSRAVRSSRSFLRRFFDAMAPLKKPHHRLRLTKEMKEDIDMWILFLEDFNGTCYIPDSVWSNSDTLKLYTDSAGSADLGCGVYFNGKWAYFPWPRDWHSKILLNITFLEMIPVLLSICLWGQDLRRNNIRLMIDNEALVTKINKQTSLSKPVMLLLRRFVLLAMQYEIVFKAFHVSSKSNSLADAISREQWSRFFAQDPEADPKPQEIPASFLSVISRVEPKDF